MLGMRLRGARATTAAVVAAAVLLAGAGAGWAAASARATGAQALGTGTYGAQVVPTSGAAAQAGAFPFTVGAAATTVTTGLLRSTGTLPVTRQDWTVVVAAAGGNRTVVLQVCDGGTWVLAVCTGTVALTRTVRDGTTDAFTTSLTPASRQVEVRLSTATDRVLTGSISISVPRTGAPASRTVGA